MVKKIREVPTLIVGTKQTKFRGVQIFGTKKIVKRFRLKMITLQTCLSTRRAEPPKMQKRLKLESGTSQNTYLRKHLAI